MTFFLIYANCNLFIQSLGNSFIQSRNKGQIYCKKYLLHVFLIWQHLKYTFGTQIWDKKTNKKVTFTLMRNKNEFSTVFVHTVNMHTGLH